FHATHPPLWQSPDTRPPVLVQFGTLLNTSRAIPSDVTSPVTSCPSMNCRKLPVPLVTPSLPLTTFRLPAVHLIDLMGSSTGVVTVSSGWVSATSGDVCPLVSLPHIVRAGTTIRIAHHRVNVTIRGALNFLIMISFEKREICS